MKLRRENISIMKMRPKGTRLTRGRVKGQDLRDLENLLSRKAKKDQEEEHNCHWIGTGRKDLDY
jgi:hypothetical protein